MSVVGVERQMDTALGKFLEPEIIEQQLESSSYMSPFSF